MYVYWLIVCIIKSLWRPGKTWQKVNEKWKFILLDLTQNLRSKICLFNLNANIKLTTAIMTYKPAKVIREIIRRNIINIFIAPTQLETILVAFLN
jgi:hypothetical protein